MIKLEQLYAATDYGLDIIAIHYPDAREAAREKKPIRMRNERTPSGHLRQYQTKDGLVWKLTDFGGEGKAMAPIDIHMKECNLNFGEAILDLAAMFGVSDELNKTVNRPDITREPAGPEQKDGDQFWELDQDFTEEDCRTMGPRVTPEDLQSLHWYRARFIARVKDREVIYTYSNERYPIFVRECWYNTKEGKLDRFYKIYKPKEPDKQWRFSYWPRDKKPKEYTNGLFELAAAWTTYNESQEKIFFKDPANEGKSYNPEKLPEAIICSGERDSMCARALGYWPVWFNSETYDVSQKEYAQIMKYVETLYNIPDIDSTGLEKGKALALRFIDIETIWLPESLQSRKDSRGHPRKDFRDWCEIYPAKQDFERIKASACPARFWTVKTKKDGEKEYRLSPLCLAGFLHLNGFRRYRENVVSEYGLVKIDGNTVKSVKMGDARYFTTCWASDAGLPRAIVEKVIQSPLFGQPLMDTIKPVELDFRTYTPDTQYFYFRNQYVAVTGKDIVKIDPRKQKEDRYVWDVSIIDRDIRIQPDMFRITRRDESFTSESFDIEILDIKSNYFKYLINSSRIYWRKELETRWDGKNEKERKEYHHAHRFDISGEGLDEDEILEQKRCLISKIFMLGFLLHRYKNPSKPWAPFIMDNIIGENDQCKGGSGKTFMLSALRNFVKTDEIDGRNPRLTENNFLFERVDKSTHFVLIDDLDERHDIGNFYTYLSSGLVINAKNHNSYALSFAESPKFAFTTNFTPKEFSPSTMRRLLCGVSSDYYHSQSEDSDYLESRPISEDFGGRSLFSEDYTDAEWEADANFLMQCTRFYLSLAHTPAKIEPNIKNIIFRKYMRDMSENFRSWAEFYFSQIGDNLDRLIVKEKAFNDYKSYSGVNKITMQKFKTSLVGFCFTCDWVEEFNPESLINSSGRILKRIEDPATHEKVQKEMIYIRSRRAAISNEPVNDSTDTPQSTPGGFPGAWSQSDYTDDSPWHGNGY